MPALKLLLPLLIISLYAGSSTAQTTSTRIFFVRHADRETFDDLNAAGVVRANELKRELLNAGIDSVFSTNFIRTKKTVTPLAAAIGQQPVLYDSASLLIKRILTKSIRKTLLVAGHSNTVPQLIALCGCKPPYQNIPDTQFDNLFLVIVQQEKIKKQTTRSCKLIHLRYGAVTN